MQKGMIAGFIGFILLMAPMTVLGQSMGGSKHGMMDEPTLGQMGGTASKQGSMRMPHHGMMGACGMAGSMMGPGMGMMHGPGMGMMHGSGMGYGNHPMMGPGMGMQGGQGWSNEKMRTFMDETRDLRRQIHDMRFEYGEKMRNPETTVGELQQMQERLAELQKELWQQYPN